MPIATHLLRNTAGLEVRIADYGATILTIVVPDARGTPADVVLGFDDADAVAASRKTFGVVGRYANRIGGARFALDGTTHELTRNEGANHLHGGTRGFAKAMWRGEAWASPNGESVILRHTSPAGEDGYPGALDVRVTYTVRADNALAIEYRAVTDAPTVINLTNHVYLNLGGDAGRDVLGHRLRIRAGKMLRVDGARIPTGEFVAVGGTPFDFREPTPIGARIASADPAAGGYDHAFVLDRPGPGLIEVADVLEPESGRTLRVCTTEPSVQLFTGNGFDGSVVGKRGRPLARHGGFCLETQHLPDSPNRPAFPSTVLRPGQEFVSRTDYVFGV